MGYFAKSVVWMGLAGMVLALAMAPSGRAADGSAATQPWKGTAGPLAVGYVDLDWRDAARSRAVPMRIYYPEGSGGPWPVIVFSHGLGGSREGYAYLGRHWASHGYVSVHVQHAGSDSGVWRGQSRPMEAMNEAAADPRNAIERVRDVRFVLDGLEVLARDDSEWRGRLDLKRIGMAGHSFGAHTTLASVGQSSVPALGARATTADPRIVAAVAMSAPVPPLRKNLDAVYAGIRVPVFHMTGTEDSSPIGNTKPSERRIPFDHSNAGAADQYLLTLAGGDHMVFSGRQGLARPADARQQNLVLQATTAFWDAYLKGDAEALRWLKDGGMVGELGKDGTLEIKPKKP